MKIKWQIIIPILFFITTLSFSLFKKDKPLKSDSIISTALPSNPISQSDNDEKGIFDATIMPPKMLEKIKTDYPDQDLNTIQWAERKYGWEALFESEGQDFEVEFNKSGEWLETELENVPQTLIPQFVIKAVKQRFPSSQFKEFEIEYTQEGTFYEIEIVDDGQERELYYNDKGERKSNKYED